MARVPGGQADGFARLALTDPRGWGVRVSSVGSGGRGGAPPSVGSGDWGDDPSPTRMATVVRSWLPWPSLAVTVMV